MAAMTDMNINLTIPTKTAAYFALERAESAYPRYEIDEHADRTDGMVRPTPAQHAEGIVAMAEVFLKFMMEERV